MAATATKKKPAKKARKKPTVTPAKKVTRGVKKTAPAGPEKRTDYFRAYQQKRRANAVKAFMCVECTTQPAEEDSTRCHGCRTRARDSMAAKRAADKA